MSRLIWFPNIPLLNGLLAINVATSSKTRLTIRAFHISRIASEERAEAVVSDTVLVGSLTDTTASGAIAWRDIRNIKQDDWRLFTSTDGLLPASFVGHYRTKE